MFLNNSLEWFSYFVHSFGFTIVLIMMIMIDIDQVESRNYFPFTRLWDVIMKTANSKSIFCLLFGFTCFNVSMKICFFVLFFFFCLRREAMLSSNCTFRKLNTVIGVMIIIGFNKVISLYKSISCVCICKCADTLLLNLNTISQSSLDRCLLSGMCMHHIERKNMPLLRVSKVRRGQNVKTLWMQYLCNKNFD